ncbi:hypothetical protein ACIBOV_21505 [Micromonospora chersina]|uniref:hypothetical protein n=1 Tax=Micromonospora chersina TaxID=47854 RepID=UPI0037BCF8D4
MNAFVRRLGDASGRRPKRTIGAWALLAALGGAFLDNFTAPGSDSATARKLLEQRFTAASWGVAVAVFAVDDGERLEGVRADVEATLARLAEVEHVAA